MGSEVMLHGDLNVTVHRGEKIPNQETLGLVSRLLLKAFVQLCTPADGVILSSATRTKRFFYYVRVYSHYMLVIGTGVCGKASQPLQPCLVIGGGGTFE